MNNSNVAPQAETFKSESPRPGKKLAVVRKTRGRAERCARDISESIHAYAFRLKTDGRKWKQLCAERRALTIQLAIAADPDGSNITVGATGLSKIGCERDKVFRILADLANIRLLNKDVYTDPRGVERDKLSKHNTKVRRLDFEPLEKAQDILESTGFFDGHPIVKESDIHAKESDIRQGVCYSCKGIGKPADFSTRPYNLKSPVALMPSGYLWQIVRVAKKAKAELAKRNRTAPVTEPNPTKPRPRR